MISKFLSLSLIALCSLSAHADFDSVALKSMLITQIGNANSFQERIYNSTEVINSFGYNIRCDLTPIFGLSDAECARNLDRIAINLIDGNISRNPDIYGASKIVVSKTNSVKPSRDGLSLRITLDHSQKNQPLILFMGSSLFDGRTEKMRSTLTNLVAQVAAMSEKLKVQINSDANLSIDQIKYGLRLLDHAALMYTNGLQGIEVVRLTNTPRMLYVDHRMISVDFNVDSSQEEADNFVRQVATSKGDDSRISTGANQFVLMKQFLLDRQQYSRMMASIGEFLPNMTITCGPDDNMNLIDCVQGLRNLNTTLTNTNKKSEMAGTFVISYLPQVAVNKDGMLVINIDAHPEIIAAELAKNKIVR